MNSIRLSIALVIALLMITLSGCKYGMNAGSIDYTKIKTISIYNFPNESGNGPPYLSQRFTEKLRSYIQANTKLIQVKSGGDWEVEGSIISYRVEPVSPQANQTAAQNRLTVVVKVKFINNKANPDVREEAGWEQSFSCPGYFPQDQSLSQNEANLIESITDQIIQDTYNKMTSNW